MDYSSIAKEPHTYPVELTYNMSGNYSKREVIHIDGV